jgi:N-acylglucosamine 2-epimerase
MKLWWVHCEALYANLLNYHLTKEAQDLARYQKTHDYLFQHFVDAQHDEWFGYLDRYGKVTHRFKGGAYKGCFHVPRALWLCLNLPSNP